MRGIAPAPPRYKVGALELDHGLAPLRGCADYDMLRLLVRLRGRPIGWLQLPTELRDVVPAERIRAELRRQLGSELVPHVLRLAPAPAAPPIPLPPISVVVCTRDRTELLEGCLRALVAQDYEKYEIIVVDNAPATDATARLAAALPVRYVREDRPGLDWARNRGAHEARHEIVAYTDDDARADAHWLRGIAAAFADPSAAAVTGLVAPAELDTAAQVYFEDIYGGMKKGLAARVFDRTALRPRELIGVQAVGVGANMAYRRPILDELGGFDTALDVGTPSRGGGDLDMFHRMLVAGHRIRYEPTALVWHRHRRALAELERQLGADGRAFGVYLLRILRNRTVARHSLLRYAVWEWSRWLTGRLVLGLLGRHRLPLRFLWAGFRGMLEAPWAYMRTYRSDRKLRQATVAAPQPAVMSRLTA